MILREARRRRQSQHRDARGQPVPKLRRCFHPCFPPEIFSYFLCSSAQLPAPILRVRVHILLDLQIIQQV
jgi:hypothetical protein